MIDPAFDATDLRGLHADLTNAAEIEHGAEQFCQSMTLIVRKDRRNLVFPTQPLWPADALVRSRETSNLAIRSFCGAVNPRRSTNLASFTRPQALHPPEQLSDALPLLASKCRTKIRFELALQRSHGRGTLLVRHIAQFPKRHVNLCHGKIDRRDLAIVELQVRLNTWRANQRYEQPCRRHGKVGQTSPPYNPTVPHDKCHSQQKQSCRAAKPPAGQECFVVAHDLPPSISFPAALPLLGCLGVSAWGASFAVAAGFRWSSASAAELMQYRRPVG